MTLTEFRELLHELYDRGEYAAAMEAIARDARRFSEARSDIAYWRLCLANLLGDREEALRVLEDEVAEGRWFSLRMLRRDRDLATLQGDPDFERLVAASQELWDAAQAAARPLSMFLPPEGREERGAPLLAVPHGNGGTAGAELGHWRCAAGAGWALLLPQSTEVETPGGYSWWDADRGAREVWGHVRQEVSNRLLDRERIVIGGFSAGAGLAMRLALSGTIAMRGFIAVAPALLSPAEIRSFLERAPQGLRGYIVAGNRDRDASSLAQAARSLLREGGISCEMETHSMGHSYPGDFCQSLSRALEFVAGG